MMKNWLPPVLGPALAMATTPVASVPVLLGPVLLGPILRGPVLLAPVLMRRHTRRALDRNGVCRRRQLERRPDRIDLGRCLEVDRRAGGGRHALFEPQHLLLHVTHHLVVLFVVFEEIGDVQERVALQADVDKGRLHARQHARNPAFMDAAG